MAEQIFLVRHGETEWSAAGRHTSHTDLPLTDKGRRVAAGLADGLASQPFSLVLSSPLRRARETCELAGFGEHAELDERLHEWEYGDYEGLTTPEIREERPDWNLWREGCPGGEEPAAVQARTDEVLERLRQASGVALVFAHGHILRVLTARWLRFSVEAGSRFKLDAGEVGVLGYERENEVLLRWNAPPL